MMKTLAMDANLCKNIGLAAKDHIQTRLTHAACGGIIRKRLTELYLI